MKDDYTTNSHYLIHFSLNGWENVPFELGNDSVAPFCCRTRRHVVPGIAEPPEPGRRDGSPRAAHNPSAAARDLPLVPQDPLPV